MTRIKEKVVQTLDVEVSGRTTAEEYERIFEDIVAKIANTGQVYVGGSDVASSTNDGLDAGEGLEIVADNWLDLADIYIDADTNGEGVDFYAVKA